MSQQQMKEKESMSRTTSEASLGKKGLAEVPSYADFSNAVNALATVAAREETDDQVPATRPSVKTGIPYLSKVESIASSAVRAAEKIAARLLVVFTHSGNTALLVAKYRPNMPILTLVVPKISSDALSWKLEGREVARQCLLVRGLLPMLATPRASAAETLKEALMAAEMRGLVSSGDRVVVVQRVHEDFALMVIAVDDLLLPGNTKSKPNANPRLFKTLSEKV